MNRKKLAIIMIIAGLLLSGCNLNLGYDPDDFTTLYNSEPQPVSEDNNEESSISTPENTEGSVSDTEDTEATSSSTEDTEDTENTEDTDDSEDTEDTENTEETEDTEDGSETSSEEEQTPASSSVPADTTTKSTTAATTVKTTAATTAAATTKATTTAAATTKAVTTAAATTKAATTAAITTQPVNAEPSPPTIYATKADGKLTSSTSQAIIDYSNTTDGYVMAKYTGSKAKVKVVITYPNGGSYSYDLNAKGTYEAYPLTGGNGSYSILVAENVSGDSYATAASCSINVSISNSIAPYLRPSHMVDFSAGDVPVTKASQVCAGAKTNLQKIERIYQWVVDNVNYDYNFAATVTKGYVASPAKIINEKKGICYDYAVGIAAMLRSQGIPTQVVFGNVTNVGYHAWVNVYTPETGWICGAIYFDGSSWKRMDATLASSNRNNNAIYDFINNNSNYYSIEKLY